MISYAFAHPSMVDLSSVAGEPYPALCLAVGGGIAVLLAAYGRREDSLLDELGTVVAFAIGIAAAVVCIAALMEDTVGGFSAAILAFLAACLFFRPLKCIPWALVFGLVAGAAAAIAASYTLPSTVLGAEEWKILLLLFLVVGGLVWLVTRIIGGALSLTSTVLGWRISTLVLGLVALAEGISLLLLDSSLAPIA